MKLDPTRGSYNNSELVRTLRYKQLIIKSNGYIKYTEHIDNIGLSIEGPVIKWKDKSIETFNGSSLNIDFHRI